MYVERLKIENMKCFESAQIDLNHPRKKYGANEPRLKNVNLLLGVNGVGKTTLCQALCIAVLKNILATSAGGFLTSGTQRFIRQKGSVSDITATLNLSKQDGNEGKVEARGTLKDFSGTEVLESRGQPAKWAAPIFDENAPSFFLAAYSVNRRTERPEAYNERLRHARYHRVATLFEPHVGLIPFSLAMRTIVTRHKEVRDIINKLVTFGSKKDTKNDYVQLSEAGLNSIEPTFDADGAELPLSALSDGYRMHIGWIVDFITQLAKVLPLETRLDEAEGVVIVDEIDLLLHPEWQRYVVETLAEAFPRIQFLLTTHSPIVVGTLEAQNLFLVERIAPHTSHIQPCEEKVFGLSIDTILVRLFGLQSPRAPYLEEKLAELAEKAQKGDRNASLEYLHRLSAGVVEL